MLAVVEEQFLLLLWLLSLLSACSREESPAPRAAGLPLPCPLETSPGGRAPCSEEEVRPSPCNPWELQAVSGAWKRADAAAHPASP